MLKGELLHSRWPPLTAHRAVQSDASIVSLHEIEETNIRGGLLGVNSHVSILHVGLQAFKGCFK